MKYSIKTHILDHAYFSIDDLSRSQKKLIHFNSSVDTTYFIRQGITSQKKIDEIMVDILKNISEKKIKVKEKNGLYIQKNGKKKQKYRIRTIHFSDMLSAYHSSHFDASRSVNPHFHFLFPHNVRIGKDFLYLRKALDEEAQKYGLKFNFMEPKPDIGLAGKQLNKIESLSWLLNQGHSEKIKAYFSDEGRLAGTLDLLHQYYMNTGNVSYYMKILQTLNQRMREYNLDFDYRGINLKENIYFFLSSRDKEIMADLSRGREVRLDMGCVLDREIIKFAYGFGSDAIELLCDKFKIKDIEKSQLYFTSNTASNNHETKPKNDFRSRIIQDMRKALSSATSEKSWKDALLSMGYQKVSIKSRKLSGGKREKTGLNLVTAKGSRVYISFSEASLDFSQITKILMSNKRKKKRSKEIESALYDYQVRKKKKRDREYAEYIYQVRILLQIYSSVLATTIEHEALEDLAKKYNVSRSNLYDITTFKNDSTTIVDDGKNITLKKSNQSNIGHVVSDMLDIAVAKGWDIQSLHISGDEAFVHETKRQIAGRLESHKNPEKRRDNVVKYTL